MKKLAWALSYCLLLLRQSFLLWVLLGIQALATLGSSQGREILKSLMNESENMAGLVYYEIFHLLTGLLYFSGCYWF